MPGLLDFSVPSYIHICFYMFLVKGVMLILIFWHFLMGGDRDISRAFTVVDTFRSLLWAILCRPSWDHLGAISGSSWGHLRDI